MVSGHANSISMDPPVNGGVQRGYCTYIIVIPKFASSNSTRFKPTMPHYFVTDPHFSWSTDPLLSKCQARVYDASLPRAKSTRGKPRRARSGSIAVSSLNDYPSSPINRFAQSMGPEKTKFTKENDWTRHTTPAMACARRGDFYFAESWDLSYSAKSNRRSVWQRFTENVDKCVIRVVSKFYK